ncbi:hypothetical protein ACO22_03306 [Paracoccidioides brasiliensis]|uniref:Uncharacterized protein n=1 Tax=Paracoccidioides brasiliensis TaxID=121759 RepID=A0A1D2JGK2_PARBR|nr:hypothetical protein ACO22_03306 [Paracoccidioides brasiliensis]
MEAVDDNDPPLDASEATLSRRTTPTEHRKHLARIDHSEMLDQHGAFLKVDCLSETSDSISVDGHSAQADEKNRSCQSEKRE